MRVAPCKECSMKGCGAFHDVCPDYQNWKAQNIQDKDKEMQHKALMRHLKALSLKRMGITVGQL